MIFNLDKLEALYLSENKINDKYKDVTQFCEALTNIKMFSLKGNPVCATMTNYEKTISYVMKKL